MDKGEKIRVLHISGTRTHPANKGNAQAIYRLSIEMQKRGWDVDFLYYGNRTYADLEAMREFFGEEHFILAPYSDITFRAQLKKKVRNILDSTGITRFVAIPYSPDELFLWQLAQKVKRMQKEKHYDVIWFEYFFQSRIIEYLDDKPVTVIYTHDRFGKRNRIFQKEGKVPEWIYLTAKGERQALSRADLVAAIQEKEAEYFEKLLKGTKTKVITTGHLVGENEGKENEEGCFGFLGARNGTNRAAVEYFTESILPSVREENCDMKFVVAGAICKSVPDDDKTEKLGIVDDLEDFYDRVSFVISPLTMGTGLNIKNIEALSYGKPLLTTSVGAKGLEDAKDAIIVCDDPAEFAHEIMRLSSDKTLRAKMSAAATQFVKRYNAEKSAELKAVEDLVSGRR